MLTDIARQSLVEAIVRQWPDQAEINTLSLALIRGEGPRLLGSDDWEFILRQADKAGHTPNWLGVIEGVCRFGGMSEIPADTGVPPVDAVLQKVRDAYARSEQRAQQVEREQPSHVSDARNERDVSPSVERVREMLRRCEAGELDAWWHLNFLITDQGDGLVRFDNELNLRLSPGWHAAERTTRSDICNAAKWFLGALTDVPNAWLDGQTVPFPVAAGLRAWFLLLEEAAPLPTEPSVWARWIDVMVRWPFGSNTAQIGSRFNALLKEANSRDSDAVRRSLATVIASGPLKWEHYLDRFAGLWTDELAVQALTSVVGVKASNSQSKLEELDFRRARQVARILVTERLGVVVDWLAAPQNLSSDGWSAVLAGALATPLAQQQVWARFKGHVLGDSERFQATMRCLCEGSAFGSDILVGLDEHDQGAILCELDRYFPASADLHHREGGAHFVTVDESVRYFRDALLNRLRTKGTRRAYEALSRFAQTASDKSMAARVVAEARERMRREVWQPLTPEDIVRHLAALGSKVRK